MLKYSEMLKEYIRKSGKTLDEISNDLKDYGFNISKGYISQLQNGKTGPASDELNRALAEVTSGNLNDLLISALMEKAPTEIKNSLSDKLERLSKLQDLKGLYNGALLSEKNLKVKEVRSEHVINQPTIQAIPLLGSIAAGQPIARIEQHEGVEFVDSSYIRNKDAFALTVKGDSMIGDHIEGGDVVICISQTEVLPSEIAVVAVDDETATLKRVKFQDHMCILIPSNPKLQPIIVPADQVHILGKVIEVRKRF